jgi:hypothetical protein
MAFYPKTTGVNGYRFAKAREDCTCLICLEPIKKGDMRYIKGKLNLCTSCKNTWYEEGGRLGNISRSQTKGQW